MPDVQDRARIAAIHWNLTVGEKLTGGSRSAVYAARDELGRDLVLKLPQTQAAAKGVTAAEAAALVAWANTGAAVALVDATADALLLVRVRPGTMLAWRREKPLDDLIEIAADLLRRLWSAPPGPHRHSTLEQAYLEKERVVRQDAEWERRSRGEPDRGRPGLIRLPAAATAAQRLISTTAGTTLLHGDFITKNLLSDRESPTGWIAVDPLPVVGDPAAEVAAFAAYQPAEFILPIAEALAARVNVNPKRALGWTAVWSVHQAAQSWRDDQDALERMIESSMIDGLLRV
jgi:streptomycin 6-kinase